MDCISTHLQQQGTDLRDNVCCVFEDVDVTGAAPTSSTPQVPSDLLYFPSSPYTGGLDGTAASGSNDCYFKRDR